jgi:Ricin-type beta-trefoil lectin domain
MKLAGATSLLSVLVASALADEAVPSLRSASGPTRELTVKKEVKKNHVGRGEPSYLEFYNYRGHCLGFNQKRQGEKANIVDCDDSDAALVVYRSDDLLELYNTNLCLEADGSYAFLYECDAKDDKQRWFFPSQKVKGKRRYRICNEDNKYCMEKEYLYEVKLEAIAYNDLDQLFILDKDFFDTE